MYLNNTFCLASLKPVTRLTLTLDVFKSFDDEKLHLSEKGLTLTLDVFKFFYIFLF